MRSTDYDFEAEIIGSVMALMDWDHAKATLWYKTPNPNFGGASPERLVEMDRGHKIEMFISSAKAGNFP